MINWLVKKQILEIVLRLRDLGYGETANHTIVDLILSFLYWMKLTSMSNVLIGEYFHKSHEIFAGIYLYVRVMLIYLNLIFVPRK